MINGGVTAQPDEQDDDSSDSDLGSLADFSPDDVLTALTTSIGSAIDTLFRLNISICNTAPHDRIKMLRYTDTSHFEPYDIEHVRTKFSSTTADTKEPDPDLVARLGKAISWRRQYFRYQEMRREMGRKTSEQGTDHAGEGKSTIEGESTLASSIPLHLRNAPPSGAADDDDGAPAGVIDEDAPLSDAGASRTSFATTLAAGGRPKVPPLPKGVDGERPFECPFCFSMVAASTRAAWKRHVFSDLRPYICLDPDCPVPNLDYERRRHWKQHLKMAHWKKWSCTTCTDGGELVEFSSARALAHHLSDAHRNGGAIEADDADLGGLITNGQRQKLPDEPTLCPLCGQEQKTFAAYTRHVGRHQEDLALFALPQLPGAEEDENEDDENDEGRNEAQSVEAKSTSNSDDSEPEEAGYLLVRGIK